MLKYKDININFLLKYKEINAVFLLKYKDLRIFLLKVTFCLRQIDYSNSGLYNRFCFTSFQFVFCKSTLSFLSMQLFVSIYFILPKKNSKFAF